MEKEWEEQAGAMMNQMVRICTRIGNPPLNLDELDMAAPVFDSFDEWHDHLETCG